MCHVPNLAEVPTGVIGVPGVRGPAGVTPGERCGHYQSQAQEPPHRGDHRKDVPRC